MRTKAWARTLHWPRTALLLAIALLMAACGGGTDAQRAAEVEEVPSESSLPDEPTGTGPGGQPSGRGGAPIGPAPGRVARPAPINIPALEQSGNPPSHIAEFLEPRIAEQCGGSLCVTLAYVDQDGVRIQPLEPRFSAEGPSDPEVCGFDRRKSGVEVAREVERGSTVALFFDCHVRDAGEGGSGTGSNGAGVGSETDDTVPPTTEATSGSATDEETSLGTAAP